MKNQWFGDRYDFRKYGLLYFLSKNYYDSIMVAWMLTEDDIPKEGTIQAKIWGHLSSRKKVAFAQEIFDDLPQEKKIIFFDKYLNHINRQSWLDELKKKCSKEAPSLIFFDADNGFEDADNGFEDTTRMKKETYIYLDEIKDFTYNGIDVLLYQHRTQKMLKRFETMCDDQMRLLTEKGYSNIKIIKATGDLAFFLIHIGNEGLNNFENLFIKSFGNTKPDKKYLELLN